MTAHPPVPTPAELEILSVLWRLGESTVRETHNALVEGGDEGRGYSTTLKMMQIMHEKGLLLRDDTVRPQLYRPSRSSEATQQQMLGDLQRRAFGGSAARLVLRALASEKISKSELEQVRSLVEKMEKQR